MGLAHKTEQRIYRKIYRKHFGEIPKGYHIHHIDFNPYNHDSKNLIAVSPEEHAKIHNHEGLKWATEAGIKGAKVFYSRLTVKEKKEWHRKGGQTSRNPGGYSMSEKGKTNISKARMKSKIYTCPYGCISKRGNKYFDGGNLKLHMISFHKKVDS